MERKREKSRHRGKKGNNKAHDGRASRPLPQNEKTFEKASLQLKIDNSPELITNSIESDKNGDRGPLRHPCSRNLGFATTAGFRALESWIVRELCVCNEGHNEVMKHLGLLLELVSKLFLNTYLGPFFPA